MYYTRIMNVCCQVSRMVHVHTKHVNCGIGRGEKVTKTNNSLQLTYKYTYIYIMHVCINYVIILYEQ